MSAIEPTKRLLQELLSRLPELEWKVSEVGAFIYAKKIPKGLFRNKDLSGSRCMAEIKMDIHALAQQENPASAQYLADKISRKIEVLVALCQLYNRKKPTTEKKSSLGLNRLSTRQQWIAELEEKIATLEQQQQALLKTIEEKSRRAEGVDVLLQLRVELGELEKRLTLAREMYQSAIS